MTVEFMSQEARSIRSSVLASAIYDCIFTTLISCSLRIRGLSFPNERYKYNLFASITLINFIFPQGSTNIIKK